MTKLADFATIIRSKNAGPFRLTFDVFFNDAARFNKVVETQTISPETVADVYCIDPEDIIGIYELPKINAIKISINRPIPAGDPSDSDVYGAQQHRPLSTLVIDE
jgi:hypothetical protein